jgi:Electron transfer DM13
MNLTKKISVLVTIIFTLSILGIFYYNYTLSNSIKERENTPSRLIKEETKKELEVKPDNKTILPEPPKSEPINKILKKGSFVTLDVLHYASGDVILRQIENKYYIEFQDNFKTNPDGPDLRVWLVKEQKLGLALNGVNTDKSQYLYVNPLAKFSGKQTYEITKEEYEQNNYAVVIWCEAFKVQFSHAILY